MRYEPEPDETRQAADLSWRVTHVAVSDLVVIALVTHAVCITLLFLMERLFGSGLCSRGSYAWWGSRRMKKKMY
jgi:hypothetical protein